MISWGAFATVSHLLRFYYVNFLKLELECLLSAERQAGCVKRHPQKLSISTVGSGTFLQDHSGATFEEHAYYLCAGRLPRTTCGDSCATVWGTTGKATS